MTKGYWLTPEEVVRNKKRKKVLLYISFVIATVILSAVVTLAAHNL